MTAEEIISWWDENTFEASDVFLGIKPALPNSVLISGSNALKGEDIQMGPNEDYRLTVVPTTTTFGKCYSVQFHEEIGARMAAMFKINMTAFPEIGCVGLIR